MSFLDDPFVIICSFFVAAWAFSRLWVVAMKKFNNGELDFGFSIDTFYGNIMRIIIYISCLTFIWFGPLFFSYVHGHDAMHVGVSKVLISRLVLTPILLVAIYLAVRKALQIKKETF